MRIAEEITQEITNIETDLANHQHLSEDYLTGWIAALQWVLDLDVE